MVSNFIKIDPEDIYVEKNGIVSLDDGLAGAVHAASISPAAMSTNAGTCANGSCPGSDNLNCSNGSCSGAQNYGQC